MSDKTKIVDILKFARRKTDNDDGSTTRPRSVNISVQAAVILVLIVAGIFITGFALQKNQLADKTAFELEALKFDNTSTAKHLEEVRAYSDRLELRGVRVQHINGEVMVSGEVRNIGRRGVVDVELSVYCLDGADRAVCTMKHISTSSDGEPLGYYQRRKFNITIPNVPDTAKDVHVVVSDIRFQEPEKDMTNERTE